MSPRQFVISPVLALALLTASPSFAQEAAGANSTEPPTQSEDEDDEQPIAIPPPPAGMGQVVFYRPELFVGGGVRCRITEGETMISRLGNGNFFVHVVTPETHEFSTRTEARDVLTLEVEPDETQFVRCRINMGLFMGRPNISPSTAEEFAERSPGLDLQRFRPDEGRVDPPAFHAAARAIGNEEEEE
ncbi:MAG: hypothetical protein H7X93_06720 [Sphingomonadaceae bacterium]|nr:hypothetical protein [Sphingomonadaceae bacterium]